MTIKEIVKEYNELNRKSDNEIVECEFCGTYSMWGGYIGDPKMWYCEKCNKVFCHKCHSVAFEDKEVLCPDCKEEVIK